MINPHELRVENWVDYVFGETKVTAINMIHREVSVYDPDRPNDPDQSHDLSFDKINPIPLTEEWLKLFGFDNFMEEGVIYSKPFFNVHLKGQKFFFKEGLFSRKIESVHHLQNLYFILTGEELELKTRI